MVKVYLKPWYKCPQGTMATKNDLDFLKEIIDYEKINPVQISKTIRSGLQQFPKTFVVLIRNFGWFCLLWQQSEFCRKKKDGFQFRTSHVTWLPKTGRSWKIIGQKKNIPDFVSCNTLTFFDAFNISTEFTKLDPTKWDKDASYIEARNFLKSVQVVNDCAERKIKLIQNYNLSLTKNEKVKLGLLLGVEKHRKIFPNCNKFTLLNKKSI